MWKKTHFVFQKKTLDFLHWPLYRALFWHFFCENEINLWISCTAITTLSCLIVICCVCKKKKETAGLPALLSPLNRAFFCVAWLLWVVHAHYHWSLFFLFGAGIAPAVGPWICLWLAHPHYHWSLGCWSLLVFLVSFVIVSFAAWLGFCGWFITGILDVGLFWCYWSLLLCGWASAGGLCPLSLVFFLFAFLWVVYAHYHWSLCCWSLSVLLVSFVLAHYLNPCRQTFPQT